MKGYIYHYAQMFVDLQLHYIVFELYLVFSVFNTSFILLI